MELILIRHAHAGERAFGGRDRYRPLSDQGHAQAVEIARTLAHYPVAAVLSSPASRCVQTVEPLAETHGLEVVEEEDLWEVSTDSDVSACLSTHLRGIEQPVSDPTTPNTNAALVACSHGNLIPPLVEGAASQGATVDGRGCERGSIWIITFDASRPLRATYLSPRKNYRADGATQS